MKIVSNALEAAYDVRLTWNNAWTQIDRLRRETSHIATEGEEIEAIVAPNLLEEAIPQKVKSLLRGISGEFYLASKDGNRTWSGDTLFSFVTKMRDDRAQATQKPIPTILIGGQIVACRMYYYHDKQQSYFVSFEGLQHGMRSPIWD